MGWHDEAIIYTSQQSKVVLILCINYTMHQEPSQTSPIALFTSDWMTAKNAPKRAPTIAIRINKNTRQEQHRYGCLVQHPLGFVGPSATFLISVPWLLCSSESDILWDTSFSNQFSHLVRSQSFFTLSSYPHHTHIHMPYNVHIVYS